MYREDFKRIERDAYWTFPRAAMAVIILMIALYGIGFIATGGDLAIYRFWAPKMENAKREVFENTQSYVQGKISYLSQMRLDYESTMDMGQKQALRRMILTEAAQVDNSKLPADLRGFILRLKGDSN